MEDTYRSQFRLPYALYEHLKSAADNNKRSVNAELVARLEESFVPRNTSQDADVTERLDALSEQNDKLQHMLDEVMTRLFDTFKLDKTALAQKVISRSSSDISPEEFLKEHEEQMAETAKRVAANERRRSAKKNKP